MKMIDTHVHLWDFSRQPRLPLPILKHFPTTFKPSTLHTLLKLASFQTDVRTAMKTFVGGTAARPHNPITLRYMPSKATRDFRAAHVKQTVYIECGWYDDDDDDDDDTRTCSSRMKHLLRPVAETRFAQACAENDPAGRPNAIVAFADLRAGRNVVAALRAHRAASPRFRGIRHSLAHDPQGKWVNAPAVPTGRTQWRRFYEGLACLAPRRLLYECWLYANNLPKLVYIARRFPTTTIVCDHMGLPTPATGSMVPPADWYAHIRLLAACPNVVIKLSGWGMMPFFGHIYSRKQSPPTAEECAHQWRPYLEHAVTCFGSRRCMLGSNFPVDRISFSYVTYCNAMRLALQSYAPTDRANICYRTAQRVYRLQ